MAISIGALEEGVLCLLVFSPDFSPRIASKVNPEIFTTRVNQKIASAALDFITSYKAPPQFQIEYLLEKEMLRGEEGKLLAKTLEVLKEVSKDIQPSFIMDELDRFLEIQTLSKASQKVLEALQAGDLTTAKETLFRQSLGNLQKTSNEILLSSPQQVFAGMDRQQDEFFSSAVELFDQRNVRPERGTMFLMIGSAGAGKTWWIIATGKAGLQHRHSVLHITLEVSKEIVAQRYLQSMFSLTDIEAKTIRTPFFNVDAQNNLKIDFREIKRDSIIGQRKELWEKLQWLETYPPLIIAEFPTGALSDEQLAMYLDSLERERGFKPDEILLDYPDLMRIAQDDFRIGTGRLYKNLRGMAVSRNACLNVASQSNREGEKTKVIGRGNVAEDWSKIGTADVVFTYSQTPQEYQLGLARLLVEKSRNSRGKWMALISQSYDIGQFCLDSTFMQASVAGEVEKLGGS